MPKGRRKRQMYAEDKRRSILTTAQNEGLTAAEVKKRFGVTPVTYYSWRKKYGVGSPRGQARTVAGGRRAGLGGQVRSEVQARVRQILPGIVKSEVDSYLNSLFGSRRGRGRKV
ncbi:MAG TPA: transposase [Candidatus Limnocylindria bacterium]|nr:transposase [Candidatus Limnocylindria bacterium]